MSRPIVECERLVKTYPNKDGSGGIEVRLDRLSLRPGEVVLLDAPSGSGKSTLLDMIALILKPSRIGRFVISEPERDRVDVANLWKRRANTDLDRVRRRLLGYVLQRGGLLPFLDVRRNMEMPLRLMGRKSNEAAVYNLSERLGIAAHFNRKPAELSVGERQRAAVGRAVIHRPRLLLADEPTASLDAYNSSEVMTLFATLSREAGAAVLISTHGDRPECLTHARCLAVRMDTHNGFRRTIFSD
jgi:putative ABC transport system ATP-binding protein